MPIEILNIVAPVFLLIAAGYSAVRVKLIAAEPIDHLMKFAIHFAIPCLLFRATSTLDLAAAFDWRVLLSYYLPAIVCFGLAFVIARKVFKRRPGEAVAIGFAALFSNLVMLGLPISERAWGVDSLAPNFALVSVNAPICYLIGITAMEYFRADGRGVTETARVVLQAMFRNSLMIGIGLGFIVNLASISLPESLLSAIELLSRAALPVALFALGGALTRYTLARSLPEASCISAISLLLQPLLTLMVAQRVGLALPTAQSIVLMSAMAPGLNAYLFASRYQRGLDAAASTVLLSTLLSVITISAWLIWL